MRGFLFWVLMIANSLLLADIISNYWKLIESNPGEVIGFLLSTALLLGGLSWFLINQVYLKKINGIESENKLLKAESDNAQKDYQRNLEKRDEKISELESEIIKLREDIKKKTIEKVVSEEQVSLEDLKSMAYNIVTKIDKHHSELHLEIDPLTSETKKLRAEIKTLGNLDIASELKARRNELWRKTEISESEANLYFEENILPKAYELRQKILKEKPEIKSKNSEEIYRQEWSHSKMDKIAGDLRNIANQI